MVWIARRIDKRRVAGAIHIGARAENALKIRVGKLEISRHLDLVGMGSIVRLDIRVGKVHPLDFLVALRQVRPGRLQIRHVEAPGKIDRVAVIDGDVACAHVARVVRDDRLDALRRHRSHRPADDLELRRAARRENLARRIADGVGRSHAGGSAYVDSLGAVHACSRSAEIVRITRSPDDRVLPQRTEDIAHDIVKTLRAVRLASAGAEIHAGRPVLGPDLERENVALERIPDSIDALCLAVIRSIAAANRQRTRSVKVRLPKPRIHDRAVLVEPASVDGEGCARVCRHRAEIVLVGAGSAHIG